MKDIAGVEIELGDTVAGAITGYNALRLFTVTGFTPKMVKLSHDEEWGPVKSYKLPNEVAVVKRLDNESRFV